MAGTVYNTARWRSVRERVLARDGARCTVSRLLGGDCSPGPLHVHHIVPVEDGGAPYDEDNLGTACARHHPTWESLRRRLARARARETIRCPHSHRSLDARLICEARLARRRQAVAA
jgi:5-methylcytosine-specific restriction endonuclease McrA